MSKYLFIGAHVDEELCFAGTMIKLLADRHGVDYITFDFGASNVDEFSKSCNLIGCCVSMDEEPKTEPQHIANWLYGIRSQYDFMVTHSVSDRHPLHRRVAEESQRVFNGNLLTYIGPWNGNECANYFVELSEEHLEKKIQAMACYKSQARRPYMTPEFIHGWAVYQGIKCGKKYAEGFYTQRLIV